MPKRSSAKITGFPPVVDKSSAVLILGSMPGVPSLRIQEYYGNPRNQFWRIMGHLLGQGLWKSYEEKKKVLLKNRIALWDVVGCCRREGSLDSRLCEPEVNDFATFFKQHPKIRAVFCNGQTAFHLFQRSYGHLDRPVVPLPSTSPAHTMPFDQKLTEWTKVMGALKRP